MHGWFMRMAVLLVVLAASLASPGTPLRALDQELEPTEQTVLQELFTLGRRLEETRGEQAELDRRLAEVSRQEAEARAERDRLEAQLKDRRSRLGRRLRYYREQGQAAPLGVLLGATSLTDFMGRLDIVTYVIGQDSRLIRECQELKTSVAAREEQLHQAAAELGRLRTALTESRQRLEQEIAGREALLVSLRERRAAVEAELASLERVWEERALPVLVALGTTLQNLDASAFQPDSIQFSFLPPGATAVILAQSLDAFFARQEELKGLHVLVRPGSVSLEGEFDGAAVQIAGRFVVVGKTILRFEPKEVSIRDFQVPAESLASLLADGHIDIDVSDMVKPFVLQAVSMAEGELRVRAGLK